MTSSEYENASSIEAHNNQKLSLLREFSKIHKSESSPLTKEEAYKFLTSKGNFENKFIEKIMKGCFPNEEQNITVGEFIKNLIYVHREINNSNIQINLAYQKKKQLLEELKENLKKNQNEILNDEGLSYNSIVKIDLFECSLKNPNYEKYIIKISSNENTFETKPFKANEILENEKYEFKPKTKNDIIIFELREIIDEDNDDNNLTGQASLDLNELKKQEEYEILLNIPSKENSSDVNSQDNIAGTIKAKVIFIWSYLDYYKEQLNSENQLFQKLEANLNKTQSYLNQLKSIDAFNDNINNNVNGNIKINNIRIVSEGNEINKKRRNNNNNNDDNLIFDLQNMNIENFHDLSKELPYEKKTQIYYLFILWVVVFIVENFSKNDFVNGLTAIFTIISITYANKFLNYGKILMISSIVFDLIWILFCSKSYWKGKEGFIHFLGALFTLVSIGVKGFIIYILTMKNK